MGQALSKAELTKFQRSSEQSIHELQDTVIRLTGKPIQFHSVDRFLDNHESCV